jgi:uridylate kinase
MSAVSMPTICETYARQPALHHLDKGQVVVLAGGTGNPFFTTDTSAVLRAAELRCDAVLKATQVDGVYSADPKKDPDATRFDRLTHDEAIARDLKVMDTAAFALAREKQAAHHRRLGPCAELRDGDPQRQRPSTVVAP